MQNTNGQKQCNAIAKHSPQAKVISFPAFANIQEFTESSHYGWFPIIGNSMTNTDNRYSIPNGSLVLASEIEVWHELSYPLRTPILLFGIKPDGESFCLCKTISFIDAGWKLAVRCTSYNTAAEYKDFWIPFASIKRVFIIEQIKRPATSKVIHIPHSLDGCFYSKGGQRA